MRNLFALVLIAILAHHSPAVQPASDRLDLPAPGIDLAAGLASVSSEPWSPPVSGTGATWQAFRSPVTKCILLAAGQPFTLIGKAPSEDELATAALQFVNRAATDIDLEGCRFKIAQITHTGGSGIALVRAFIDDVPVYGAYAIVVVNRQGQLIQVKARGFGSRTAGHYAIDETYARTAALQAAGLKSIDSSRASKWYLPRYGEDGTIVLNAAYQVELFPPDPSHRPAIFIDAVTGIPVAAENRIEHERLSGTVTGLIKPLYGSDQLHSRTFPHEWLLHERLETYTDPSGNFAFEVNPALAPFRLDTELRGRWVDVNYDDGEDASLSVAVQQVAPVRIDWGRNNGRDDERSLYWHTNFIHDYWKRLDPGFRGMDYPVPATAMYGTNYDNAFWNGHGMFFGDGDQMDNFALYADVVYHEYGHGVTGNIYPRDILPYRGESGALNEAWSDYFPCSITNEPLLGEGGLVGGNRYIRNIDNNLIYPRDIVGEVHYDSRIISAAMWHTRAVLGASYCDSLFHFTKYRLGNDFLTYFTDILIGDDDDGDLTNGTPNDRVLYGEFGRHGIGPGIIPKIAFRQIDLFDDNARGARGNDDLLYEPGEALRVEVAIERLGVLFPPPARTVRVSVETTSPHLAVGRASVVLGDMRVGDRLATAEPLLLDIAGDAPLDFAGLRLFLSDDEHALIADTLFQIPLGRPAVCLVKDGVSDMDRTEWLSSSLTTLGVVHQFIDVYAPRRDLAARLTPFRTLIWFTGDAREGILRESDRLALQSFLDRGGNLLLTGQSAGRDPSLSGFLRNYLGAEVVEDSTNQIYCEGVAGDPVGQGLRLLMLGAGGAMNQRRTMAIAPVNDGVVTHRWTRREDHAAAGVRRLDEPTGSKTLYFAFGVEAVGGHGGTATRLQALAPALTWLDVPNHTTLPDTPARAQDFTLESLYPNPFNAGLKIDFRLARNGRVRMALFDLTGRELTLVLEEHRPAGRHTVSWEGTGLTAGLYLMGMDVDGKTAGVHKVVLVK